MIAGKEEISLMRDVLTADNFERIEKEAEEFEKIISEPVKNFNHTANERKVNRQAFGSLTVDLPAKGYFPNKNFSPNLIRSFARLALFASE